MTSSIPNDHPRGAYQATALQPQHFICHPNQGPNPIVYQALQDVFVKIAALSQMTISYYYSPSPFANDPLHLKWSSPTHQSVGVGFGRNKDGQLKVAIRHVQIDPQSAQVKNDVVIINTEEMILQCPNISPRRTKLRQKPSPTPASCFITTDHPSRIALREDGYSIMGRDKAGNLSIQHMDRAQDGQPWYFAKVYQPWYSEVAAVANFRHDSCTNSIMITGPAGLCSFSHVGKPFVLREFAGLTDVYGVSPNAIIALSIDEQIMRIDGYQREQVSRASERLKVADRKSVPNPKITNLESYYQHRKTVCAISLDRTRLFICDKETTSVTVLNTTDLTQSAVLSWDDKAVKAPSRRLMDASGSHLVIVDWHDNAKPKTFWNDEIEPTEITATCHFLSLEHGMKVSTLQFTAGQPVLDSVALGERLFIAVLYNPKTMTFSHEYFDFRTPQNRAVVASNNPPAAAAGAGAGTPPQAGSCALQ